MLWELRPGEREVRSLWSRSPHSTILRNVGDRSIRLADVPVPKVWVAFWRSWAFPVYLLLVWCGMRRNRGKAIAASKQLGFPGNVCRFP
jgi:hypothetical protein